MTLEDNFIINSLENFIIELKTDKPEAQVIDKYACILTAYMIGKTEVR